MVITWRHFFTPLFSFAIDSHIDETDFTLGLSQKYHFEKNTKRREKFLQRKQNRLPVKPSEVETGTNALSCDMCEFKPASEKGLRQHKRMKHGPSKLPSTVATPKRPRQQIRASGSLSSSPLLDTNREEPVESEEESEVQRTSLRSVMHIAYVINHRIVAQISPKTAVLCDP